MAEVEDAFVRQYSANVYRMAQQQVFDLFGSDLLAAVDCDLYLRLADLDGPYVERCVSRVGYAETAGRFAFTVFYSPKFNNIFR